VTPSSSRESVSRGNSPFWVNINAKAEGIASKPAFRKAFERRRCLVPVDSFYEWRETATGKPKPYALALADRGIMALAGLWENWQSPADEWVRSFAIVPSRPGEFHPEPLTDPDLTLSRHRARVTERRLPPPVETWSSSCCQLAHSQRR
jgi:SOS response associated peptidase (SRAP)